MLAGMWQVLGEARCWRRVLSHTFVPPLEIPRVERLPLLVTVVVKNEVAASENVELLDRAAIPCWRVVTRPEHGDSLPNHVSVVRAMQCPRNLPAGPLASDEGGGLVERIPLPTLAA